MCIRARAYWNESTTASASCSAELLGDEGISVRTGAQTPRRSAQWPPQGRSGWTAPGGRVSLRLEGGEEITAQRLAWSQPAGKSAGRGSRVQGGRCAHRRARSRVDASCRAAEGIWAVGDITGVAPFTHVAAYQSRIAAADDPRRAAVLADYSAIPRVVFGDPKIACVGVVPAEAESDLLIAQSDLSESDRTETYGRGLRGHLGLAADPDRQILLGAWAIGPLAGEWIHQAALAVKARIPLSVLADSIIQFPTFSELFGTLARDLHSRARGPGE